MVYDDCVRYGWRALKGDKSAGFPRRIKRGGNVVTVTSYISPDKVALAPCGKYAGWLAWCVNPVKDILNQYKSGRGPGWENPDDMSNEYRTQINSEIKKDVISPTDKQVSRRWVKIASRPNHLWDCEAMQIALALYARIIRGTETEEEELTAPAE
jgi:hypothetical protein